MIIVDIKIGIDGIPSEKNILLGNKYENNDTIINFELPSDFDNYNKYVIAVNGSESRIIPVLNNRMTVSSALTELAGNWAMYLMCRETSIDLSAYVPDISAKDNEHVFISDGFIGTVVNVQIDKRTVEGVIGETSNYLFASIGAMMNPAFGAMIAGSSLKNLADRDYEYGDSFGANQAQ